MNTQDSMTPNIDQERCTGCGDCEVACPEGILTVDGGYAVIVHPSDCQYCGNCEELCPAGAISRTFEIILLEGDDRAGG